LESVDETEIAPMEPANDEPEEIRKSVMINRKLGPYELKEHLGSGGFGRVYLATYKEGDSIGHCALKVQWNRHRKRNVEREWKALNMLNGSSFIIKGRKWGEVIFTHNTPCQQQTDAVYLPLEICEHGNLYDFIRQKEFSEELIREYWRQFVEALKFMREKKIIHRDIKLSNILIGKFFNLKVADFGTCVFEEREKANGCVGTRGYTAPEVVEWKDTKKPYDYKVDIFSSGCMLFTLKYRFSLFYEHEEVESLLRYLKEGDKISFWNTLFQWMHSKGVWKRDTFKVKHTKKYLESEKFVGFPMVLVVCRTEIWGTCYSIEDVERLLEKVEERSNSASVFKFEEMDLLDDMLAWKPSDRADINKIMAHATFKNRTGFSPEKLVEELKKIKAKVDDAKGKDSKKEESSYAFAARTKNRSGNKDDDNIFSKKFPDQTDIEYPTEYLQRIFQKKRENFESFEQDLNKIARIYNEEPSPIMCYTKLEYGDKPYEAMKILLAVLDRCGADVVLELDEALAMKVSLTLEGKKKVQVQCLMHIYKPDKETDDRSIIEVRNLSYGDDDDFQNFFEALKKWLLQ